MMHHIKTGCIVLLALLVSVAAFVACDFGGGDTQLGSLEIILQDRIAARTIAPLLDMEVDLWNIRANRVGSDYQIGPVDVTADTHSFTGILSGTWVVTVEAYNNDSPRVKIGEGSFVDGCRSAGENDTNFDIGRSSHWKWELYLHPRLDGKSDRLSFFGGVSDCRIGKCPCFSGCVGYQHHRFDGNHHR